MNSWDFRATASYNDVYNKDHIVNLFGGLEINSLDRSRSYFNGVGMQYDMGYLPAFNYNFFKQLAEVLIHIKDDTLLMVLSAMRVPIS